MAKLHREKTDYDYTMEELSDRKSYTIKNRCFLCEIKIDNSWEYFSSYGNCCTVCSARVARVASRDRNNPIRGEEALRELNERRNLVKSGKLKKQV